MMINQQMDNKSNINTNVLNQGLNTPIPQVVSSNASNSVAQDILVTQKVDPNQIPTSQLQQDLEMFKKAEEKIHSKSPELIAKKRIINSQSLPMRQYTEREILQIKNPFRGE